MYEYYTFSTNFNLVELTRTEFILKSQNIEVEIRTSWEQSDGAVAV